MTAFTGTPAGTWTNAQPRRRPRQLSPEAAETALVGHLLLDPTLAKSLDSDLWSSTEHRLVHDAVQALAGQLTALTTEQRLQAVVRWMHHHRRWSGAAWELTRYTSAASAAPDVDRLVPQVTAAARRRRLAAIADQLHQAATGGDPAAMATTSREAITTLQQLIEAWSPLLMEPTDQLRPWKRKEKP